MRAGRVLVAGPLPVEGVCHGEVLVEELHAALLREVCRRVPVPSQDPLGGEQPLQTHRPAGMDTGSTDANLRTWGAGRAQDIRVGVCVCMFK